MIKRKRDKGRQPASRLTINGRIRLRRRWWHSPEDSFGLDDLPQLLEFVRKGWDIGSGPTESRCKVATCRLKRAGQRWNPGNAETTAAFTTLEHSGQWQQHWKLTLSAKT